MKSAQQVWLKRIALSVLVLVILALIAMGVKSLLSGGSVHKKRQVTTVKLIPDTPPPPPPPPPKEPPKEQPKEQPKEIKVEQPKPDQAPPAENLKMEGAAGDGPSPFGAGTVNNEYKGGDVNTIGSDGGAKYRWYAGVVKNQIETQIARNKNLTQGQYKFVVHVWLKKSGEVERVEVVQSDASEELTQELKATLKDLPAMSEATPQDMPQPIKLRISARR